LHRPPTNTASTADDRHVFFCALQTRLNDGADCSAHQVRIDPQRETAKTLGLAFLAPLLGRADEVIE
jgi:hypothetical protein